MGSRQQTVNMSSCDLRDGDTKPRVSYEPHQFTVEINVKEYSPEDLMIKTEEDVLIILAKQESKSTKGKSFVTQQFEQRFTLPTGVDPHQIKSSLSNTGVLKVTAPRNSTASNHTNKKAVDVMDKRIQKQNDSSEPILTYDDEKFQIKLNVKDYKPDTLDVKVEGNYLVISAKEEIKESGGIRTKSFEQKFSIPPGYKLEKIKSALSAEGELTISAPKDNKSSVPMPVIENNMQRLTMTPRNIHDNMKNENTKGSPMQKSTVLGKPISNGIMKERSHTGLERSDSACDDNSLFSPAIMEENSSKIEYDGDTYKILVNVQDYDPEELEVKTTGTTVSVKAKHDETLSDGRTYSTKSFDQSFTLPKGVNPDDVSSGLSKDGILTISAPLPTSAKNNEKRIPINSKLPECHNSIPIYKFVFQKFAF